MDIDTMEAGRELDALIAEKVMGFAVHGSPFPGPGIWATQGTKLVGYLDGEHVPAWTPSTDISAAWEVVEKAGEMGYTVNVQWKGKGRTYENTAEVSMTKSIVTAGHAVGTAPLAICRAALLLVPKRSPEKLEGN